VEAEKAGRELPRLEAFDYKMLGTLAALGHYNGVGKVMGVKIKRFLAWWVWRTYYLMQMPRWNRRVRIVLDWTTALVFRNDVVKLDFGEEEEGGEGTLATEAQRTKRTHRDGVN
jgi:NADH:ubiquinone reductase (H+-translocating)